MLRLTEDAPSSEPTDVPAARALQTYTGLLERTRSAYSTTAAEDREALDAAGNVEAMAPRTRLALQFRLTQKTMLDEALTTAVDAGAKGISDAAELFLRPSADGLDGDCFDFDLSLTDLKPL